MEFFCILSEFIFFVIWISAGQPIVINDLFFLAMVLNESKCPKTIKFMTNFENWFILPTRKKNAAWHPFKMKKSFFDFERCHAIDKKHLPNFFLCLLTMHKVKKRQKRTNKKFVRCFLASAKFFFMSFVNAQGGPKSSFVSNQDIQWTVNGAYSNKHI